MRNVLLFNDNWTFVQSVADAATAAQTAGAAVDLPHTWNSQDGQDGGNDYHRGTCWYVKKFARPQIADGEEAWLEFRGVAMTADVYVNGRLIGHHEGGYSTFRVAMTECLQAQNTLAVAVDNSRNRTVYPQKADFTFYGGIYRDVYLIIVPKAHFALGYHGAPALKVTPEIQGSRALVTLEAWTENAVDGTPVLFAVENVGEVHAIANNNYAKATLTIEDVHLWDGLADPYLYKATTTLPQSGDRVQTHFGCRTIHVDPQAGFFLNGRHYPLCGAARHQDRLGVGNAINRAMQREDLAIMLEMGLNTVRLAHYQHDQYFYDLCDRHGIIAWAEIPYITEHMPEARANTISQMTELALQSCNHPSIVCWGLSNEITAAGGVNEDLVENHRLLNDLCHRLDPTRFTVMAHAFMLEPDHPLVRLPDVSSYNLYYGWYVGDMADNDQWFDDFHNRFPQVAMGLSEYGADANPQYQNSKPEKGDYSESYQAVYHEHMLAMWRQRPYIWAIHCWNMFDFAADGRNEGGKPGQNQKGLVTFDRKLKKDAYYIYKAFLSLVPFVHICGRRYVDRAETITEVKVYSNQNAVTLTVDGQVFETQTADKVFRFAVPITGNHQITASCGGLEDHIEIRRVSEPDPAYSATGSEVINWFDKPEEMMRDGYFSVFDTILDMKQSPEAAQIVASMMDRATASFGEVAKDITMPESVQKILDATPLMSIIKQASKGFSEEMIQEINHALNQIRKQSSKTD